jgi:hypothetical protein
MHRAVVAVAALAATSALAGCAGPEHLPTPPDGVGVRVLTEFAPGDQEPVRICAHPVHGQLYVLGGGGDVWMVNADTGARRLVLRAADYIQQPKRADVNIPLPIDRKWVNAPITLRATLCLGLCFDKDNRLYIVANVLIPDKLWINRVDIYRTEPVGVDGIPAVPALWTRFDHAYGVGGFNHGACRIAQGPDGMIYLASGSRTDHGEAGDDPHIGKLGERPDPAVPGGPGMPPGEFTAVILRFDPAKGPQTPEVYSRGNRNPFGFDWDDQGRLIDAEHGPMADHPEELNWIRQGKHYGFPYVFGNGETPNYTDTPQAPAGVVFEPPIRNVGPGGLLGDHPMYSMSPHAAPGGMIFYRAPPAGPRLPDRFDKTFFLCRFGNLVNYNRIGFDILAIKLEEDKDGTLVAKAERFLDRLSRPIDLCARGGRLYVVEYCRQHESAGPGSENYSAPGRILEVFGKP